MAFEVRIFNDISRAFSPDLPRDLGTMDQHLDFILPKIIPYGEDLREEQYWIGKRWKEVRDDEGFHEAILHIFNNGGEYLLSLDGNLVLTKHGDQGRKGQRRFFCLIHERSAYSPKGELDWRNVMEKMFNVWRENSLSLWAWLVFIAILGLIVYLSVN